MADLQVIVDDSTAVERRAVDHAVGAHAAVTVETERLERGGGRRRHAARQYLLPGLHALQREIGWISPGGMNYLCAVLLVPPAEAYGVASF